MPILNPLPARKQDREMWSPRWQCYCCHDTGLVPSSHHLAELVGENYPYAVRCNASGCSAGREFGQEVDTRAPADWCDEVARRVRADWQEWLKDRHERQKAALGLIESFTDTFGGRRG